MSEKRFLLIMTILILLIRAGYILTLEDRWYFYDTVHYDTAAQHIVQGDGFGPSLYFSNLYNNYCLEPVYPLFLAGVYALFGHSLLAARLMQAVLGLLSLLLFYLLGREILPPKTARWILIIGAFYPFYIYITGLLYITQLFTFFVVLSLWAFVRYQRNYSIPWLVLAAAATGIAVLCRPIYLVALPLIAFWILFMTRQKFPKKILSLAVLGVVLLAVFTPWTVRNYMVFKRAKFARACLPQGQVYGETFWNILREKSMAVDTVDIHTFAFGYSEQGDKSYLDCYVNGSYFFTLNPYDKMDIPDSSGYWGVLFSGPPDNRLQRVSAYHREISGTDTTLVPVQDSGDILSVASMNAAVVYQPPAIIFDGGEKKWNYGLLFSRKSDANYFVIEYPANTTPDRLHSAGLMAFMDKNSADANGYMVWVHPWKEPDLWWIKNGVPYDSVPVLKAFASDNNIGLFYLLTRYPSEYIFEHFIPEFLKFWSPKIIRVVSEGSKPGPKLQWVSIISFTPLLLLLPVGLWALRKQWCLLALYLIPIVSLSGGYALYFSQTRYRIPVDGFLILFAVLAVHALYTTFTKGKPGNPDVQR